MFTKILLTNWLINFPIPHYVSFIYFILAKKCETFILKEINVFYIQRFIIVKIIVCSVFNVINQLSNILIFLVLDYKLISNFDS